MQTRRSLRSIDHGGHRRARSRPPRERADRRSTRAQRSQRIRDHQCPNRPGLRTGDRTRHHRRSQRRHRRRRRDGTAPADARIIDGTGLTVYPGLIDANSSIGHRRRRRRERVADAGRGGRRWRTRCRRRRSRAHPPARQTRCTRSASARARPPSISLNAGRRGARGPAERRHHGGAHRAVDAGIFRGLSAVINLGGSTSQAMIVKAPIAEHIGFTPSRGGGYPNSLLGVFSALRQTLLDAQHYGAEQAAYAKNPRGMRRPETDPSLEALQPVLARQIPVVMEASVAARDRARARSRQGIQPSRDHRRRRRGGPGRGATQGRERAGAAVAELPAPPAGVGRRRSGAAAHAARARRSAEARGEAARRRA